MNPRQVQLRPATHNEAGEIRRLVRQAGINPFGLDWRRFTLALASDGKVIGCGQLKPHGNDVVELASLVVEESWRGLGIGRRLVEELIDQAGRPLWLMCGSSLVPLYEKFGFVEVAPDQAQPGYFARMRRVVAIFNTLAAREQYLAIMVLR
jgi:N-acetylglutamate synthase-like GNAT family acetyltransferase